jgi:REP element-mobilizing transposase RayT
MSKTEMFVHLVWSTHHRKPVIPLAFEERIHRAIDAKCAGLRSPRIAVGGTDDHIHLLARLHPMVRVAQLAGEVKGLASYLISHKFLPGRPFNWQEGYYAVTVSPDDVSMVVGYISDQRAHHAANHLLHHLECL